MHAGATQAEPAAHLQLVMHERKVLASDEMPNAIAHLTMQQHTSHPVSFSTYPTVSNSPDHPTTSPYYTPGCPFSVQRK